MELVNIHPLPTGLGLSFLLEDKAGLFLVDCGSPGQERVVIRALQRMGRHDLRAIWVTHAHYDHYGSAARLRGLTGAPVGIHALDSQYLLRGESPVGTGHGRGKILRVVNALLNRLCPIAPTPVDFTLGDGETLESFGLNAMILHTPGHTPGHTCLVLEDKTAFAADLIARNPRPRLQDLLATDWPLLPGSLARLQAVRPTILYTGHSRMPLRGEELQQIRSASSEHLVEEG